MKLKYVCLFTYKALTSDYTSDYFFKRYVILMDQSFFPPLITFLYFYQRGHENGGEWLHFVIIFAEPSGQTFWFTDRAFLLNKISYQEKTERDLLLSLS